MEATTATGGHLGRLTREQKLFLKDQGIDLDEMFDASGLRLAEYRSEMLSTDKLFAYGTTPCIHYGHTLRNRSGKCIQCNTLNISFARQHRRKAHVYLAGSRKKKLIKVGTSADLNDRIPLLNHYRYGRARDWQLLCHVHVDNAGVVERKILNGLGPFLHPTHYEKDGRLQECKECFKCSYAIARWEMLLILDDDRQHSIIEEIDVDDRRYDFPNW